MTLELSLNVFGKSSRQIFYHLPYPSDQPRVAFSPTSWQCLQPHEPYTFKQIQGPWSREYDALIHNYKLISFLFILALSVHKNNQHSLKNVFVLSYKYIRISMSCQGSSVCTMCAVVTRGRYSSTFLK